MGGWGEYQKKKKKKIYWRHLQKNSDQRVSEKVHENWHPPPPDSRPLSDLRLLSLSGLLF